MYGNFYAMLMVQIRKRISIHTGDSVTRLRNKFLRIKADIKSLFIRIIAENYYCFRHSKIFL
jgi:hypothetical protein